MNPTGYFVTAKVLINPQWSAEEGKRALEEYCQVMQQQEAGCSYALALQDNAQPRCFILWERYDSQADYHQHFKQPHTCAFIKNSWISLVEVFETTR